MPTTSTQHRWPLAVLLLLPALAACKTNVENTGTFVPPAAAAAAAPLPRPDLVLVHDFDVDPAQVRVDQGVGGTARRLANGTSVEDQQAADAEAVKRAITETLVARINAMGLKAQAADQTATGAGSKVVGIHGVVLSIDEGNRTRRNAIGLGAGKSDVKALAQVQYDRPGNLPTLLQTYRIDANSGRKPGLGVGAAGSAASGTAAAAAANGGLTVATANKAEVAADAKRAAETLAGELHTFFVAQGWITAAAK